MEVHEVYFFIAELNKWVYEIVYVSEIHCKCKIVTMLDY